MGFPYKTLCYALQHEQPQDRTTDLNTEDDFIAAGTTFLNRPVILMLCFGNPTDDIGTFQSTCLPSGVTSSQHSARC